MKILIIFSVLALVVVVSAQRSRDKDDEKRGYKDDRKGYDDERRGYGDDERRGGYGDDRRGGYEDDRRGGYEDDRRGGYGGGRGGYGDDRRGGYGGERRGYGDERRGYGDDDDREQHYDDYDEEPYDFGPLGPPGKGTFFNDYSHEIQTDGNGDRVGVYKIALPDGRTQIVNYKTDKEGFHADIEYQGEAKYTTTTTKKPATHRTH